MTTSALGVSRRDYKCKAHSPTKIMLVIPHPTFSEFFSELGLGYFGHPISSVSFDCVPLWDDAERFFFGSGSSLLFLAFFSIFISLNSPVISSAAPLDFCARMPPSHPAATCERNLRSPLAVLLLFCVCISSSAVTANLIESYLSHTDAYSTATCPREMGQRNMLFRLQMFFN